jgi:hypothetical protein
MKVLTATVLAWLLQKLGVVIFRSYARVEGWRWSIQDWAGIATPVDNTDRSSFGWIVLGEAAGGYVDSHEYKAGGTSSDD